MSKRSLSYRMLDHTADIRLRIWGRTLKGLFQNAAVALTDTLTDVRKVRACRSRTIRLRADDREALLVRFLQELLFLFDARGFAARRVVMIRWEETRLVARVCGERFSPARHPPKTEIKAVTYHGLKVVRQRGRWVAEVVLDV